MTDQLLHVEPPLSHVERAERFDFSTSIKVEESSSKLAIRREWVRATADVDSRMGYAELRTTERLHDGVLDIKVPFRVNLIALAEAIFQELKRQAQPPYILYAPLDEGGKK